MHSTVGPQNERIDLGEVAIAAGEAVVELDQHLGDAVDRLVVDLRSHRSVASNGQRDAVDRIDVQHHDGVGVRGRHGFDLDAALHAEHQQVLLRRPFKRVRRVVLLLNVAGVLDPDTLDDMALDVHSQDVACV